MTKENLKNVLTVVRKMIRRSSETAETAKTTAETAKTTADNAKTAAETAKTTAKTAKSTADAAKSTADAAKSTADAAKSTADAAKSTADAAKSTADAAKSTADAAKILPVQYNYFAGLASKKSKFLGWYSFFPALQYRSDGGFFFKSLWETEPLTAENIPSPFICKLTGNVDGFSSMDTLILNVVNVALKNTWRVDGTAIANDGRIYHVSSNNIPISSAQGIQLVFSPPTTFFLKSSTANSAKKFKITVDDAGTLSATEVTDTTT